MGLTPVGVRLDHVITGANQRTLGEGNGERMGVDGWEKKVCKLVQKYLRWCFDILVLLAVTDPLVSSGYLADRCSIAIFFMNYVKLASLDPLWPFHFPSFSLFFACCDAKVLSLERIRSTRALLIRHLARKGLFFQTTSLLWGTSVK